MARTDEEGMQQRGISTPAPIPRTTADGHASSSGENEPMHRRLRRRAGNTTAARNEPEPPLQPPPWQRSTAGSRGKAGKRRAVACRPRGPPNQMAATSSTRVDPVEDELLLDCALAMRPHAHADSSQRARIWQEIADELKLVDGTRLKRYTANGLMMRLGYLLKVLQNPLHREHGALQGTLRDKLVHYSESLPPHRPRRVAYATIQNNSNDDRRAADAESDDGSGSDNESEATTVDMVVASEGYAFQHGRNVVDSRVAARPQVPHGHDASSTRSASPSWGGPDQVLLPAIAGAAESASSSTMLMALMQQAERGWREQHDESMLLLRQSGMIHQRCLEQHQARMADQREWRTQCLSLFAERPPADSARREEDPSDSDECDSSDERDEKRGCRKAC